MPGPTPPLVPTALLLSLLAAATAAAQQPATSMAGDGTYRLYCASCHGTGGKGDGPLADALKRRPPDLTRLAAANGGTYPADLVARAIDGRSPLKGHGGGDMPVWGDAFTRSGDPTPASERIARLVRYLERIQGK